jgi:putative ABC transport system permease protein
MILTLLTLSTGGAVFLGALNLKAAIRGAVDVLFSPQRYDVTVRLVERHRPDSVERALTTIDGVAGAEAWSGVRAAVAHDDGTLGNAFAMSAPPANSRLLAYSPRSGRWFNRDGQMLVVSTSWLAQEPGFSLGARVPLVIGGRTTSWTIIGIVDAGPSASAFAPRAAVLAVTGNSGTDLAVVRLSATGTVAQFEAIQRLRQDLGQRGFAVSNTQLVAESRRVMEDHLLMVADFLGGMAWLMIVVGGLGLASTMSLSVLERTREIGVLRAIGARHGAILAMVQVEGLVIAVLSWLVALPLSIPMSVALGRAFGRVMLPVPDRFLPAAMGVVWWLALVLAVSAVACAWPALRAMRIPTRAALAYE